MRRLIYEIADKDIGKVFIRAFGRPQSIQSILGAIQALDVGKRIYFVPSEDGYGGVLQVENADQRDARLGKLEVEGYAGH